MKHRFKVGDKVIYKALSKEELMKYKITSDPIFNLDNHPMIITYIEISNDISPKYYASYILDNSKNKTVVFECELEPVTPRKSHFPSWW